jgi:hypothetical protein
MAASVTARPATLVVAPNQHKPSITKINWSNVLGRICLVAACAFLSLTGVALIVAGVLTFPIGIVGIVLGAGLVISAIANGIIAWRAMPVIET